MAVISLNNFKEVFVIQRMDTKEYMTHGYPYAEGKWSPEISKARIYSSPGSARGSLYNSGLTKTAYSGWRSFRFPDPNKDKNLQIIKDMKLCVIGLEVSFTTEMTSMNKVSRF